VLVDAFGKTHVFIEKVPVITTGNLEYWRQLAA
jgi:hypothetical protein